MRFTEGPQEAQDRSSQGAGFAIVATTMHYSRCKVASYVSERDAPVLAAAPELYAALEELTESVERWNDGIIKIMGRQPNAGLGT